MKLTFKNVWITINILLCICMVYFAFAEGFSNSNTLLFMGLTNGSVLVYFFVYKQKEKKE